MGNRWTLAEIPPQAGRIAVVTGANSGLGLETAVGLAGAGATVVMACRDPGRAQGAVAAVQARAGGATVEAMPLDLADLASVRAFAQACGARFPRIDLLVNNAGVMALPLSRTRDGFEMQIGTNHLGHYALTAQLLPFLKAAPQARIVTVASLAHRWTRGIDLDDLNFERRRYDRWDAYGKSKLANLIFTQELARRLVAAGSPIIAAAAHPGYTATNLGTAGVGRTFAGRIAMGLGNALFGQAAAIGALPTLHAATAPGVAPGDYIGPGGLRQLRGYPVKVGARREVRDPALAGRLWELSERLTGVRWDL